MLETKASASVPPRPLARAAAVVLVVSVAAGFAWLAWSRPWEPLATIVATLAFGFPHALGLLPGIWIRRGAQLAPAADALERRRPVWAALSQLYLDTELDAEDLAGIAAALATSGYGEAEAEEILYRELHPVLFANLLSVAGEWVAFDGEWLEAQILARGPRRTGFALIPGKWLVRGSWAAVRTQLRVHRGARGRL